MDKFSRFSTSTIIDGNYVGIYNRDVFRIIEKNKDDFVWLVNNLKQFPYIINSKIKESNEQRLIIKHEKLDCITYYSEWTQKQRVNAALAVIELQESLVKLKYYLKDPHSFNISYKFTEPVYFDLGSIRKGTISPGMWFIKCFTGWKEKDYWDSVLNINRFKKVWLFLRLFISNEPYEYLKKKIRKYESGLGNRFVNYLMEKSNFISKVIGKLSLKFPHIASRFTNWTTYDQKNPLENLKSDRTKNLINLFKDHTYSTIIDIGANKGAYSYLALDNGFQEAVCLDLDPASLDFIQAYSSEKKLKLYTANINIMDYDEAPGCYKTYSPAHERLKADFGICLAVVHHICYFGNKSFDEFAERLSRFVNKKLIVEFIPYDDVHLTGPNYKGKDRSWYTQDNFIKAFQKYFPDESEIYNSTPKPRILIQFNR
jgi:hypothetical protein